jgi:predicted Zn-dependent protease with MMP-like domain
MPYRVSRTDFDSLIEKAVEELPEEFKKYFSNITIMIEDYPSGEDKMLVSSKLQI